MKIILSKYAGFCYGVDNAIKITDKTLAENPKDVIYMLGELVHNEEVIKKLKEQGIKLVKLIKDIPQNSTVILSAHGHSPKVYEDAQKRNLKIVDATCPMVTRVHILGRLLGKNSYFIIIIGDRRHGEVKAIFDQIKTVTNNVKIVENLEQAKKIKTVPKIGIISQTTQSLDQFGEVVAEIAKKANEIKIFNTICDATRFRQHASQNLAKKVNLMIVVGSFQSANTKRLTSICQQIIETHQVNSANDLKPSWFKNKKTVGISAGASTPKWIIKEVINQIKNFSLST